MNPFTAFSRGLRRSVQVFGLAVYSWLAGFLFTLAGVLPVYFFLQGNYGKSPLWQAMGDGISWTWLGDVIFEHGALFSLLFGGVLGLLLGMLALSLWLSGGLIAGLRQRSTPTPRHFLRDCGDHFLPLLRLFLLSLPVYLIAVLAATMIAGLFARLNADPLTQWGTFWLWWLRGGLLVGALLGVNLVFDFARIALIGRQDGKAWRALREALSRLRGRSFWRAGAVYLLGAGVTCALVLVYLEISRWIPTRLGWVLFALLPLQQGLMLGRQWSRLLFLAGETEWWEGNSLEPVGRPVTEEAALDLP